MKIRIPGFVADRGGWATAFKGIADTQRMIDDIRQDSIERIPPQHLEAVEAGLSQTSDTRGGTELKGIYLNRHHCLVCEMTDAEIMSKYIGLPYWFQPKVSVLPVFRIYESEYRVTTLKERLDGLDRSKVWDVDCTSGYLTYWTRGAFIANLCSDNCAEILDEYMAYPDHYCTPLLGHLQGKIEVELNKKIIEAQNKYTGDRRSR
jgi:hypothetical protein